MTAAECGQIAGDASSRCRSQSAVRFAALAALITLECIALAVLWHWAGIPPSFNCCTVVGDSPTGLALAWNLTNYDRGTVWWQGIGATALTFICSSLTWLAAAEFLRTGKCDRHKTDRLTALDILGWLLLTPLVSLVGLHLRHVIFSQ